MDSDRGIRRWLVGSALAVALAVAVGGITRLTESGLSITEWRPVSGMLPPLSAGEWDLAFRRYLQIPEAQTVHRGITLAQFQVLYWWEWGHRMLARAVGLVLAVPYFVFLLRGKLRPPYRLRLALLPVLAAAQGALGWYMVQSGLITRTDVSPIRLTAHLGLALAIFAICVWSALGLSPPTSSREPRSPALGRWFRVGLTMTLVTMLSGALVAGLDAGRIFNTFPLMGGRLVPPGYRGSGSWWWNAIENPVAAQFHHRLLAVATAVLLLALAGALVRRPPFRRVGVLLGLAVIGQVGLGIATLLLAVPVWLGVAHQLMALGVLTVVLVVAHLTRRPSRVNFFATSSIIR